MIEDEIATRIGELMTEGVGLRQGNEWGQRLSEEHAQRCQGWLAAAGNIVEVAVPDPNSSYRRMTAEIVNAKHGYKIPAAVGKVADILTRLLKDAQSGLVSSIADRVRAEVFDDFLDHAKAYLSDGSKNQAGVIAGVVFEDSLRSA